MAHHFKVRAANGKRGIVYLRWRTWWLDARSAGGTRAKLFAGTEKDAHEEAEKALLKIGVDDTLGAALKDYCDTYRKSKRPSTVKRTIPTLEVFGDFVGLDLAPEAIRQSHVQAYVNMRRDSFNPRTKEPIKRITIMNEVACIRTLCRVLQAKGQLVLDPCLKLQYPDGDDYDPTKRREKAFTVEAMDEILKATRRNEFAHDWVLVAATVGLRPAEESHARGVDLDDEKGILYVRGWGDWRPKTRNATRALDLAPEALEVLMRRKEALADENLPLFHSEKNGVVDLHNVRARIVRSLPEGTPFGLYRLRHTFAVRAREMNWPMEKISAYLGHCSIRVTESYAPADSKTVGAPPVFVLPKQRFRLVSRA